MRTYEYRLLSPIIHAPEVWQQIHGTRRYYNKLVELERERREQREALSKAAPPEVLEAARTFVQIHHTAQKAALSAGAPKEAAREAGWKAQAEAIAAGPLPVQEYLKALEEIDAWAVEEGKRYYLTSGLYWGQRGLMDQAFQAARRSGELPSFSGWNGSGSIGVQIQHGLSTEALLSGEDSRARILRGSDGKERHRELHIRIGSDGRDPIFAVFPLIYDRDLPSGAMVKWVRVHVHRVGTKFIWHVHLVLDGVMRALPEPKLPTVAIDVGWRLFLDGIRVAVWADAEGKTGELRLPRKLLDRWEKTWELRSIRDKSFNGAIKALIAAWDLAWPEWLRTATTTAAQWKSPARLADVVVRWRTARFDGDEAIFSLLESWRKQDKHLLEWEANQRENVLRSRREYYRLFALEMAKHTRIAMEKLDLRDFAEKNPEEDPAATGARPRRFVVALSTLRSTILDAAQRSGAEVVQLSPEWTTQRCAKCQQIDEFDAAREVGHTCSKCGAAWDQDANAAVNLLRAAQEVGGSTSRSENVEETAAAARRRRGLETRRAKSSKAGASAL